MQTALYIYNTISYTTYVLINIALSESPIKVTLAPAATLTTAVNGVTQLRSRWSFSSSRRSYGTLTFFFRIFISFLLF